MVRGRGFHEIHAGAGKLSGAKCDDSRARGRAGYMRRKEDGENAFLTSTSSGLPRRVVGVSKQRVKLRPSKRRIDLFGPLANRTTLEQGTARFSSEQNGFSRLRVPV